MKIDYGKLKQGNMKVAINKEINDKIESEIIPRIKNDNITHIWEEMKRL